MCYFSSSSFVSIESELYPTALVVRQTAIEVKGKSGPIRFLVRHRRNSTNPKHDLLIIECFKGVWTLEGIRYTLDHEFRKDDTPWLPNTVMLAIDLGSKSCRFGPIGRISVNTDIQSLGIGSYLLAQCILWAQKEYPAFRVAEGELGCTQAENLMRRTAFYKNRGFSFKPEDVPEHMARYFYKDRIDQLVGYWNKNKVEEVSVSELLTENATFKTQLVNSRETVSRWTERAHEGETKTKFTMRMVYFLLLLTGLLIIFPNVDNLLHKLLILLFHHR